MSIKCMSFLGMVVFVLPMMAMDNVRNAGKREFKAPQKATRFEGATVEEMNDVFDDAPVMAKKIVCHLKQSVSDSYRYAFFVGDPGVGKSTLAKAIAFKADWKLVFLTPGDVVRKERNATAECLIALLKGVVKDGVETVVVIDELNQLLENFESEHHDADATSKALWTFLDSQEGNVKFFFIGTMNRADKLPPQVKSRILARCIRVLPPQDVQARKRIFINKLKQEKVQLAPECEAYIDANMVHLANYTGRDFKEFALAVKLVALPEENSAALQSLIITPDHLNQAAIIIQQTKLFLDYDRKEENEKDRQERHHKETTDLNEQHFVQQQMMNLATTQNTYTCYEYNMSDGRDYDHSFPADGLKKTDVKLKPDAEANIFLNLSDNQLKHYQGMQQSVQVRKDAADQARRNNQSAPAPKNAGSNGCVIV